jgi:signal transduction histidine kinase
LALDSEAAPGGAAVKSGPLQVLIVEDNAGDARLLREMFSKESPGSFALTHILRMQEAEAHLAKGGVDILLLDMGLPDGHGLDTVRRARLVAPGVPMIVLTGLDDELLAAEAMKEGAQDYLIKGQIENRALPRALRYAIERHQMQKEAEFLQAQQLDLKNEFLSHVSHELRSPLTSIYSFTTIISDGLAGETSPQQDEYLQIILRNILQLKAMIEDLLEVTRAQTGKLSIELQRASVSDAITYALNTFHGAAKAKDITLRCSLPEDLPFAIADPIRLRQILSILLDNAVKFTQNFGAVEIEMALSENDPGHLLVTVSDSGSGIDPEMTEHIFERLYQVAGSSRTGREGLGLGLHIAKELVTRMGGKIWVQSELRKGSRFLFTLPIFSLGSIVAPILLQESKVGEGIVLLTVEIRANDGSHNVPDDILRVARLLLQECLRPDSDVLLPHQEVGKETKCLFVVARTQKRGAMEIGKRILRHVQGHELLRPSDFALKVAHQFMVPVSRGAHESLQSVADQVAAEVQYHIDGVTLRGEL